MCLWGLRLHSPPFSVYNEMRGLERNGALTYDPEIQVPVMKLVKQEAQCEGTPTKKQKSQPGLAWWLWNRSKHEEQPLPRSQRDSKPQPASNFPSSRLPLDYMSPSLWEGPSEPLLVRCFPIRIIFAQINCGSV